MLTLSYIVYVLSTSIFALMPNMFREEAIWSWSAGIDSGRTLLIQIGVGANRESIILYQKVHEPEWPPK